MSTEILQPPLDWVTNIVFSPLNTKNLLASSSWDKKLRLYDTDSNALVAIAEGTAPLLDCVFGSDSSKILFCGLDKTISQFDVQTGAITTVGSHDEPIKAIRYHAPTKLIYTGGWDKFVKAWDIRTGNQQPVSVTQMYGKCFCMDISANFLVAADSYKGVYIYDIRQNSAGLQQPEYRDQILKFQMRCIRCFFDNRGFAVSSIEGRVAWELFSLDQASQAEKFTFKCHRTKEADGTEIAYPVNALAFHPEYGTFVTGGSDGGISVWDGQSRKRLWRMPPFQAAVSGAAFNAAGTQLAVAISNMNDIPPYGGVSSDTPPPQIIYRSIKDEDVRPKAR